MELLRGRIEMMEMESLETSPVSTDHTTASSLFDKLALDHPPPPRYGLGTALRAAVVTTSLEYELGASMTPAEHLSPRWISRDSGPLSPDGLQAIPGHPMTNGGNAAIEPLSDLSKSQTLADERFKLPPINTSFRRMPLRITRLKPMLLQPITDRRRVLAGQLPDRVKRHPFLKTTLQKPLVHAEIIAFAPDGNTNKCSYNYR